MRLCENGVAITSKVTTTASTGVEMEALVAASVAALTVYDMCKALDKGIEIREIVLERKSGGKSGDYSALPQALEKQREEEAAPGFHGRGRRVHWITCRAMSKCCWWTTIPWCSGC